MICANLLLTYAQKPRTETAAAAERYKVLYRFHQNNNVSISEVAHTSPPGSFLHTVQPRGADMELQSPRGEFIFGMFLATAMTILAVTTWAYPLYSISGAGSGAVGFSNLPLIF